LALASIVERFSLWNAIHLVCFSLKRRYVVSNPTNGPCAHMSLVYWILIRMMWYHFIQNVFSYFRLFSPIWFTLVYFGPIRSILDNLDYFCPFWIFRSIQSISVHLGPFWYTSVQFCLLPSISVYFSQYRSITVHSVHFDPLRSNSIHFYPLWSMLVHFSPNLHFGSFSPFQSNLIYFSLF